MKCLVTGCAGFLGSHLCELLLEQGHEVIGIDNLVSGRRENLAAIMGRGKFSFIHDDILTFEHWPIDSETVVFHLAALADIVPSVQNPLRYHNVNVTGTIKVLEAAKRGKAKRFIYAASSSCYGLQGNYAINEEHSCDPLYPYALTKYLGEQCVMHWSKVYHIPAVSLRLFNVYGPRHRTTGSYGAVFGTWLAQMANDKPLTIVGDGKQTRDFVFVTDVAEAFLLAAKTEHPGIYNIGSGRTFQIDTIARLLGAKELVHIPKRPAEPDCTWAKIGQARTWLKWKPQMSMEDGLKVLKEHLPEYKSAPVWTPEKIEIATKDWFGCLAPVATNPSESEIAGPR
jgi:UDP-glucose 4-epimerase